VDAVYHSGISHFVFSSPGDYSKQSNDRYSVPQYDIKAAIEQYARSLGLPATFVRVAFYYENFFSFFPLQKGENRSFYFGFPQGNTRMAMTSVEDVGAVVAAVFNDPSTYIGRTVGVVGSDYNCDQYAAILSWILGKDISYNYIPRNEYSAYNFPGAEELANMFEVQRLYIPERQADLEESHRLNPAMQGFESWVKKNKQRFLNHINSHMEVFVI
jgi:NmrA-like family.